MSTIEKFVSPFIPQQFPSFYKEEGPNFIAFVKAYYEWLESTGQALQRSRSLLEYADIDTTEQEFLKYFRNTYLHSLPESIIADKRLLVKHIVDLYRAKGTPRAYELLFRLIFNEDIELYIPSDFILKPSDGEWTVPRYIEVSDSDYLEDLIGKQIYNSSRNATAVVESVNQKVVNGRLFHVLILSSIRGRFKYGERILCASVPEITLDNAPRVLGSLTAIAIENGGLGFSQGDIVDVTGSGVEAKARVAAVRDENGKVNFRLENGGSGYSLEGTVITVATALNLIVENSSGVFANGNIITSSNTSANGTLVSSNSSFLKLINFSQDLTFNTGDTVTNIANVTFTDTGDLVGLESHGLADGTEIKFYDIVGTTGLTANQTYYVINSTSNDFQVSSSVSGSALALTGDGTARAITGTAVVSRVTGGGGSGASFAIGGLVNKEVMLLNTDFIKDQANVQLNNPWNFAKYAEANLSSTIVETLNIVNREVGTIAFLSRINPGTGYSASPFVSVVEPVVSGQAFDDGFGGIKGKNADVSTSVANSRGIATAVEVVSSGYGFQPGERVFLSSPNNAGVVVTGVSVVDTDGTGDGYWKNNKGFVSDIMNIQDSYYYQNFSYEILVNRMLSVYEKIVKDLVHPSGVALFGRFRLKNQLLGEASEPKYFDIDTSAVPPTEPTNLITLSNYNTLTLNRNSAATYFASTNNQFFEVGANVARFDPSLGLLLEGQRTNNVVNSRAEGFTEGGPGSLPTSWVTPTVQTGLTRVLSAVSAGGLNGLGIGFFGTAGTSVTSFEPAARANAPAASPSQTRTVTAILWLANGSLSGISSITLGGIFLTGGGALVTSNLFTGADLNGSLTTQPRAFTFTCTATSNTDIARFNPRLAITVNSGQTTDAVIGVALLGEETASFASTPILPPLGTLASATRLTDQLTTPISSLGIANNGFSTMVGTYRLPQLGSGSYLPNLMEMNNGSLNDRIWVHNSGGTIVLSRSTGGVTTSVTLGSGIVANTPFRVAISNAGNGRIGGSLNGGAVQSVTGAPTNYTVMRVGSGFGGDQPMFGYQRGFSYLNYAENDNRLRQLSTLT